MRTLTCIALLLTVNGVYAEKLYKSVDQNGVVTYSQTRPADAEDLTRMTVNANLSAEQKAQAEALKNALRESLQPPEVDASAAENDDPQPPEEPKVALRHAKDELRRARIAYEQARNSRNYSERRVELSLEVVKERERRVKELQRQKN